MKRLAFLIAACLCSTVVVRADSTLTATVDAANGDFVPALARGDASKAAAPFAPGALFIYGENKVLYGKAAIVEMLRRRLARAKFAGGTCKTDTLETDGSTAWETGSCTYSSIPNGSARTSTGRFMTVWKRNDRGRWLIQVNVAE